jgi:hypothetical protein
VALQVEVDKLREYFVMTHRAVHITVRLKAISILVQLLELMAADKELKVFNIMTIGLYFVRVTPTGVVLKEHHIFDLKIIMAVVMEHLISTIIVEIASMRFGWDVQILEMQGFEDAV